LENQIGQLSRKISSRSPGTFPSDTIPNPKEQCKTTQLRSGSLVENEKKSDVGSVKNERGDDILKDSKKNEQKNCKEKSEGDKSEESENGKMREYVPTIPFKKKDQEKQFVRFLDDFKNLHINI